jgi:type II secretory pathway pseudopilin PulG
MKASRGGFTLFELILAIALSATLLALIGTAINLYLLRVDTSRTRVEEAQLARAILTMIADDIRAAAIHQSQDTSAIAEMMASGTDFDVDSIDEPGRDSPGGTSGPGSSAGAGGSSSSLGGSGSPAGSSATSGGQQTPDSEIPLGLNGSLAELYVDVARLPRRDELFGTITGYSNAPMALPANGAANGAMAAAATGPPSDLKTVRYFIRPGQQAESGSVAATALAPQLQLQAGGLVRQEIARQARVFAEQSGNSAILDSGQALIAPEVVHLEFRYFDGEGLLEVWEMQEAQSLPIAVEVRLWIATAEAPGGEQLAPYDTASLIRNARQYRQWVFLPMSSVTGTGDGPDSESSSNTNSSTSGSDSPSNTGSTGFGADQL